MGRVQYGPITEASGLAASRKNPGVLWTHNDSGGENAIYAMDVHGRHLGVYRLAGARVRDWEDMAIGPGPSPGEYYVYVGEIGDNSQRYDTKYIYRVPEPVVSTDQAPLDTVLYDVERVAFSYPDGLHNAETLMVDPVTGEIFVVSKESPSIVYRLPSGATFSTVPTTRVDTLEVVARLPFSTAVAGDICPHGREMLIKTYDRIFYWRREVGESWQEALAEQPSIVPYIPEPQGEAVCWAADDSGYFTLSEERSWYQAHVYFYPRKDTTTSVGSAGRGPSDFGLWQNTPNPFRLRTAIRYELGRSALVQLMIYDVLGRRVAVLEPGSQREGLHFILLHGTDLPAGVYFYELIADGRRVGSKRMTVLK